jgi:hypothetical protein
MTARDLIKTLECCDLDKEVAILISIVEETEEGYGVILKEIETVVENEGIIAIK